LPGMAANFKDSLNLPRTGFPMRANLGSREPERLAHWESCNLYQQVLSKNEGGPSFILHDGPPYANGDIHLGHALNKIIKDIIVRYKSMRGFHAPYVPGWDCHGLPIEQIILKRIGEKVNEMKPEQLRELCRENAAKYVNIQREQFKRLGVAGDWERPYLTFDSQYEAGVLRCLRDLVARGLVRRGFRTVHWDPVFRTALAEAEIEHHSHVSDSIYVRFPLRNPAEFKELNGLSNVSLVIWTTTPWTLPANLGVCLHPEFDYVAISHGEQTYVVAEALAESFLKACKIENGAIGAKFKAASFERGECGHPIFPDRTSLIMLGKHVTLEQGTGCVHTAPGHGSDDFEVGRRYGLPVVVPVDDSGCFTAEYPDMEGVSVFDANPKIVTALSEKGLLVGAGKITHEYPYSWRSNHPIIFRATEQWFMELGEGNVREKALAAIDGDVQWIPHWGQARIRSMVENRPDWCLSRQRAWGVPIPAIRSKKSGKSILDVRVIDSFIKVVEEKGSDAWFIEPLERFLPEGFVHEPTGESSPEDFEKQYDILDVWFESGASHIACLEQDERLSSPADLYLEGSDQHRGWFQSALLTAMGSRDRAPFRAVLTHGFILDGKGNAMSKSKGNVISPLKLTNKTGADVLRLWVISEDYSNDMAISDEILKHIGEAYRNIRNALRYQLGNLYDFDPQANATPPEQLWPIDAWALHKTAGLIRQVTEAYEAYEFHKIYQLCNKFCAVTLSATYHDILKDRLYTYGDNSPGRRSAQTVLHSILQTLMRLLAPVLVFTTDEAYSFSSSDSELTEGSIHLQSWPEDLETRLDPETISEVEQLLKVSNLVNEKLESLRREKIIGQSLEAAVSFSGGRNNAQYKLLQKHEPSLTEICIVSQINLTESPDPDESLSIEAVHAEGERCPRCWRWLNELVKAQPADVCSRCQEATQTQNLVNNPL